MITLRATLSLALLAACARGDAGTISVTGTVELVEADVAPLVAGRVSRSLVGEGMTVRAGDTLLTLASPSVPADLDARRARVARAAAQLDDLEHGARRDELARAESELRGASADAERAERDLARATPLAAAGAISPQQLDAWRAAARTATARRDAARSALGLLRAGARPGALGAARAAVAEAEADLAAAQSTTRELTLVAPTGGVVLARYVEPGELVGPYQPVLSLGDPARAWARVYVNQRDLPRVRVGAEVAARLDGLTERTFRGRVAAVSPRAEFTPRVALTEEERADMVFGVRIEFDDATGALKAGLPITVMLPLVPTTRRPTP